MLDDWLQRRENVGLLNKELSQFSQDDVALMDEMLKRFHEFRGAAGLPDFSNLYVAYLPVFALAMLASQQAAERQTKRIERLTWALLLLTALMAVLVVIQLSR